MADDRPPPPDNAVAPGAPFPTPAAPAGAITAQPMPTPPIELTPSMAKPVAKPTAESKTELKDSTRELLETIVFVVVLVLMLKTFLAEAFVIPTGSMADTLLGYHHKITCRQCGYRNVVNASNEAEPQGRDQDPVRAAECANCRFINTP